MSDAALTAIATALLVIVGLAQVFVLIAQKRQTRIALIAEYRQLWKQYKVYWGNVIFIGREEDEYYQVFDGAKLTELKRLENNYRTDAPTIWARESALAVFGLWGEVATRVLQGHLTVSDVYPIFGTEFLRHSRPIRCLLESGYKHPRFSKHESGKHRSVRREVQNWLIYHEGLRRRCIIFVDLLWAEAARLEDLPPNEMRSAADAKKVTGQLNQARVFAEVISINGFLYFLLARRLSQFLKRAEYFSIVNWKGIRKERLQLLERAWIERVLGNR